ncbi:MAG: FISUMP domain-containing protein, partial [Bacteroidota bacterium]
VVTTTAGNSVSVPAPATMAGTFTYNLVSVQDAGSAACSQMQTGNAVVTVNPLPTATISGTVNVCQNSPPQVITFTGGNGTYPYTFTYNINGGTSQTLTTTVLNSATISIPADVAGTFTINLISVQDAGSTLCSQLQSGSALVTVNPLPTASVSGTTAVCLNSAPQLITFTGGAATPPYTFTYNINGGTSQVVTTTTGSSVTVSAPANTAGTFTYNLVSVQDAGSTSCSQLQTGNATLTVNPLPAATISGTSAVCRNSSSPLITFTGAAGSLPYTFTYNINGGTSQSLTTVSGNSVTIAAPTNAAGTFTYNLLSVQDGSPTACAQLQPGSATVTVNPLPTATVSGTTAVCQDSPVQYVSFTGAAGTPPYTFTYNINGGTSLTATTVSGNAIAVAVPTAVAGIYSYNLVSVQDASSTACIQQQPASASVTIYPRPVPVITGPASVCVNATETYITGGSMTGYIWSVPAGGIITGGGSTNTVNVLWNSTGSRTITVNYSDANGCNAAVPSNYNVTVNVLPSPSISGLNSICTGIPATYTTESGKQQYSWTVSAGGSVTGGGTPTESSVTITWINPGANSVSVNYYLGTGCTAANPMILNVSVNPSSIPVVSSPVNPICATSSTTYSTQPGMTGYTWTVSAGGSITSGSSTSMLGVRWDNAGPQFVTANYTNSYNCTAVSPTIYNLQVNPLPNSTITENPGPVCQSIPHLYQAPADPACTFAWSVMPSSNGLPTSGQGTSNATIDWQIYGNAVVGLTGTNTTTGCFSSSSLQVNVKPKPNPVFVPCFDLFTTPGARKIILRGGAPLLPVQGVFSGNRVSLNALTGNFEFDPSGASAGVYPVTYTYTNTYGCPASSLPVNITVQNNPFFCGGPLTDIRDGKTYKTATIAGHCWMTQNLGYGTPLVTTPVPPQSDNCLAEKYCAPADITCTTYGGLYQWDEIMDYNSVSGAKGLCPPEWHLPSDAEWQQLIDNILPGIGSPDANALVAPELTDPFLLNGFYALLPGISFMDYTWAFTSGPVRATMFWSSVPSGSDHATARGLNVYTPSISRYVSSRANGFSVRCVKD